jgi:3-methyl-2-oxobutanoate hydroxymethyltransferase
MTKQPTPTIADLRALKGKRQLTKLRVETLEEAEAAERAEIDMLSVPPDLLALPEFRQAAPSRFAVAGLSHGRYITAEDYLRAAFSARAAGADAVYCAASPGTVRRLRDEGIPVVGHCGLIPSHATWTGGFKAVGKTSQSALLVWQQVKTLEEAGAFAAEIEVVPSAVAALISARTTLVMISMGAGAGCDAQYLFADDVLGQNRGHVPRHAKVYGNLAAEYDRLQAARVAAFGQFAAEVASGVYPAASHEVGIRSEELSAFESALAVEESAIKTDP